MNYSVARVFPPTIVSFTNPENYRKLKKEELLLECTQLLNEMVGIDGIQCRVFS